MINVWKQRALAQASKVITDRKMPHWSTIKGRLDDAGFTMKMSHVLRPHQELRDTNISTLCGWHVAGFRAARAFGLTPPTLIPAATDIASIVQEIDDVGCPTCFDVISDLATWRLLQAEHGAHSLAAIHLAWHFERGLSACGSSGSQRYKLLAREFKEYVTEDETCVTCKAIYQRVHGIDRPELLYTSYTTNEEARR